MWAVLGRGAAPFVVKGNTPRSERDPSLGHAYCTANYTSSTEVHLQLRAGDDFWAIARQVASDLGSPEGVQKGRWAVGMLSFLPDPPTEPENADTERPTGWEERFYGKMRSQDPFGGSLEVSNLGYTDLPAGAEDIVWSSSSWPCAPVLNANVIGHKGGLRIATVWREGAAVTGKEAKGVEEAVTRVLERLSGEGREELTLSEVTA
ncbi:hypothetical protein HDZ31DRAFT_60842 [Schizophyllum fasciatum]